jgi:putative acetyltransferase
MTNIMIEQGQLENTNVINLLEEHHRDMLSHSPVESVHALDLSHLKSENIIFLTAWIDGDIAGCGALKILNTYQVEIKSMRTAQKYLRKGVAAELLSHILKISLNKNMTEIYLETGSTDVFKPAHKLYASFGFKECPPFADYAQDPYSLFMLKLVP